MHRLLFVAFVTTQVGCSAGDARFVEVIEVAPPVFSPAQATPTVPTESPVATPAPSPSAAKRTDSFPLQVPTDAQVTDVSSVQRTTRKGRIVQMSLQTPQTPAQIATFYQRELKRHGLAAKRKNTRFGDGAACTLQAKRRKLRVKIVATRNRPSEPTEVILTWNRS